MRRRAAVALLTLGLMAAAGGARGPLPEAEARAAPPPVRGMWTWRTAQLLDDPGPLLEACHAARANEVYLAVTHELLRAPGLQAVVGRLRAQGLHVEALMGDPSWYRPARWPSMLSLIDDVADFNARGPARFAAIHLDVEPHTLSQNRGAEPDTYLPDYVEGLRRANARAQGAGMSLSADVPRKFFRASPGNRAELARAAPRIFVMLYELPGRTGALGEASEELARASIESVHAAYADVDPSQRGAVVVGLQVSDYGDKLGPMLAALDHANGGDVRYAGWAIHDFRDYAHLLTPTR